MESFLIAVARAVQSSPHFSLKNSFSVKKISFALYSIDKEASDFFLLGFGVKHIIDSLSFLFLLTHIGLNFNEKVLE